MTSESLVPFFQGRVDEIRELHEFCRQRDLHTIAMEPPGGAGKG